MTPSPSFSNNRMLTLLLGSLALVQIIRGEVPSTLPPAPPSTNPVTETALFPLSEVKVSGDPFTPAIQANREYILALDPDRLLAPFRREAGLEPRKPSYDNWESEGLDGHTAGHYLSAMSHMIAAGEDTPDGELRKRLDYMVDELALCQQANGDGYVGGIPGSRDFWKEIAGGDVAKIYQKWAPWYNLHKMFAGLRDAYREGGNAKAGTVLAGFGDWCVNLTSHLSEPQMQQMLSNEFGGMNEVMTEIYEITGDKKYLDTAERFNHHAILDPLIQQRDELTGKHANTQIPKVIGLEELGLVTGDKSWQGGAQFFWETVTGHRSVAFGGNSVSEHFNDPKDFRGMLESREGPETCNSYNMLRLTERLFAAHPDPAYADYYEKTLFNHILSSINTDPAHPGYVYFTPIRPDHYRVYSVAGQGFWCCVGTGMENPGRYGQFIYARASDGIYVNLFISSELTAPDLGLTLKQETAFPDQGSSALTLKLAAPKTFTLYLRYPGWVAPGAFTVKVNGEKVPVTTGHSSYVPVHRDWKNGDRVELEMPMQTSVVQLPDGSPWYAILHGPILLASPRGTWEMDGLYADAGRMSHVAAGPVLSLDKAAVLLGSPDDVASHVTPDPAAGALHFRLNGIVDPPVQGGMMLEPFFRLQGSRYQIYWEVASPEGLATRRARLAVIEQAKAAREAATLDVVAPGEQQPEVEHDMQAAPGSNKGLVNGRHWRDGAWIQYTMKTHGEKAAELEITCWGSDGGRAFDILADGTLIGSVELKAEKPGNFITKRFAIPPELLASAKEGQITVKFVATKQTAGGLFEVRLLKPGAPPAEQSSDAP